MLSFYSLVKRFRNAHKHKHADLCTETKHIDRVTATTVTTQSHYLQLP